MIRLILKIIKIVLALLFCAICASAIFWVWVGYDVSSNPPSRDYQPTIYSKTPAIFYVGTYAFKLPADYSFLSVSDYGGPENTELIFDIYYPDFTPLIDNPKLANEEAGMPHYDNADLVLYIDSGETNPSPATTELHSIHAGTTTDTLKTGPYGLLQIRYKNHPSWDGEYIGISNRTAIDILCESSKTPQSDDTRDDPCDGFFSYKNLSLEESFSVSNLKHWQQIVQKTLNFLAIHEVK